MINYFINKFFKKNKTNKFSINPITKKIEYGGKHIGRNRRIYEFKDYEFIKEIGSGANGSVFKARNIVSNREEVIKFYFPTNSKKSSSEIQKNSLPVGLRNFTTAFHAGEALYPQKIQYLFIQPVKDFKTFGELQALRDEKLAEIDNDLRTARKNKLFSVDINELQEQKDNFLVNYSQNSLNVLSGILLAISELHEAGYIHGDLNPGNLLLEIQDKNTFEDILQNRVSPVGNVSGLGVLNPVDFKLIDMGTSSIVDDKYYSYFRETKFILDITRKCLKNIYVYNDKVKFTDLFNIKKISKSGRELYVDENNFVVNPSILVENIMRLVCIFNILIGDTESFKHSYDKSRAFDEDDKRELLCLMKLGYIVPNINMTNVISESIVDYLNENKNFSRINDQLKEILKNDQQFFNAIADNTEFTERVKQSNISELANHFNTILKTGSYINWVKCFELFSTSNSKVQNFDLQNMLSNATSELNMLIKTNSLNALSSEFFARKG